MRVQFINLSNKRVCGITFGNKKIKIWPIIWLVNAFVLEASERNEKHIVIAVFSFFKSVCMMHPDEVMHLFETEFV